MKLTTLIVTVLLIIFTLASCAAGPNTMRVQNRDENRSAGFWKGLWHGIITPVTFIISLFNKNINIYEVRNNGNWYNFGYVLGIMIIFSGGSGGACKARKTKWD
jgi:polyferredoxin